jgi:pyruvate dehydrogenase E2 component (dihydrolipoamide acetyltransferase)
MAEVINMPRLSDTMEEGVVATWLKQIGDKVEEGDILAEIETDKATMEFESFNSGTLLYIGIQEGETAPVDQLLCIIGEEGEDISALIDKAGADTSKSLDENKKESETAVKEHAVEEVADKDEEPATTEKQLSTKSSEIPDGVVIVNMPRLSDTMEEGTVAAWLKQEGDKVEEGDILAEIETDKATMEFESFNSGTLLKIGIQEGESAKVDTLLAIIGPAGTDVSAIATNAAAAPKKEVKIEEEKKVEEIAQKEEKSEEQKKETPVAVSISATQTNNLNSNNSGRIFISPLAKKIAKEKGIDIYNVSGSGENGRIVKSDIENFKPTAVAATSSASAASSFVSVGTETFEEVPNSQMRKTIAKRLGESKFTAPHYYLGLDLDMDNAIASRSAINQLPDTKISFNDMVIKAAAMALRKHPKVNTQWTEKNTIIAKHIHIGVAVAVEDGLLVPVLPFADQMSMQQIGSKVKELAGKARNKKLQPDEMQGSTFTISNLGMFGITEFTSIINQPNSAIMSVGAIIQKPVVKEGQIVVGNVMKITLACDHRTVDGATGAAFLQTFKSYIENPIVMYV